MFRKVGCWEASTLNFVCEKASSCYSVNKFFIDAIRGIFETPITDFVSYSLVVTEAGIKIAPQKRCSTNFKEKGKIA